MRLSIRDLSKTYPGGTRALENVSLEVEPGMFGLLGPNGAGKSTLIRTIATLQRPDAGSIRFGDIDVLAQPDALRERLGYLPQDFGLYPNLSAEATLEHFCTLKGITDRAERRTRVDELLVQTNLWAERHRAVGTFSGGMRQRLGIAIALGGRPQLLALDEPTAGLDPAERRRLYNLLAGIGRDVIVLLSTHLVEDVRELCRAVAIIDRGRVVRSGDPDALLDDLRGRLWRRVTAEPDLAALRERHRVIDVRRRAGVPIVHLVADEPPDPSSVSIEPTLEDVYFHLVGERAEA